MEWTVVFATEIGVLEGMFARLCGVACASQYEGHELALSNETSIEECGK